MFFKEICFTFLGMVLFASSESTTTMRPPNDGIYVKTKSIACKSNSSIFANVICEVKAVSRYSASSRFSAFIVKPMDNIFVRLQIFKRERRFVPFLIDVREDFCKVMSASGGAIAKLFLELGKNITNINHPCPYYGLIEAKSANTDININKIPSLLPTGDFRLDVTVEAGRPLQFAAYISRTVEIGRYRRI